MPINKYLLFLAACFSFELAYAHKAHEHGTAKIDLAFEDKKASLQLEIPAISLYGFEYTAKTPQEKKKVDEVVSLLKLKITSMVQLPKKLNCNKIIQAKIVPFVQENDDDDDEENETHNLENKIKSEHGNLKANFIFQCSNTLHPKQKIQFSFTNFFPDIHKIQVQIIGNNVQKGENFQSGKGDLQL